jgi:hypothetical protein
MKLMLFLLTLLYLNVRDMDCATTKNLEEVENLLKANGKTLRDYEKQLPTNHAIVYRLPTGQIILTPGSLRPGCKSLFFESEECFQECLRNDHFPIENENKDFFEHDQEGIRRMHESIGEYQAYLNKKLKMNHTTLDRASAQDYYGHILKKRKRDREDIIALGAVMGELFRRETGGQWILEKWYGTYNPYYKPLILLPDGRIFSPYDKLSSVFDGRWEDMRHFFSKEFSYGTLDVKKQAGKVIIELQ